MHSIFLLFLLYEKTIKNQFWVKGITMAISLSEKVLKYTRQNV